MFSSVVQPEDVESGPMRAPPTESPSFSTETDDEDLEDGSGEDIMIISSLKGLVSA